MWSDPPYVPKTIPERFSGVISLTLATVRTRAPSVVMPDWMVAAIHARVSRIGRVVSALLLAMLAGTLRTRRSPAPGGTRKRPVAEATVPAMRLPRDHLWLVKLLGWHAAGCGCQLRALLEEPEMMALLAASPRAVRTLKPLCRMLGVDLPAPPAPPVPPKPAASSDDGSVRAPRRRRPRPRAWTPSYNPPIARRASPGSGRAAVSKKER